jgi:signal transduction histidine kinase
MFIRMALHIGMALAAFVLLGALSLASIAAWQLQSYVETRQSSLGIEAADILAAGGRPALEDWLAEEAASHADVEIYILDNKVNDILGRSLPPEYRNFVRTSVIGKASDTASNFQPVRLAPEIIGPDGEHYAFLVLPEGISVWGSRATALGVLAAALLVIASVAWLIARAFSRPISELQIAVRELASGNTHARAPNSVLSRRDELGALANDFNSMAEQLTSLMENRQNLMRDMSHELRTPLARMHAALALAAHTDESPGTEKSALRLDRLEIEIRNMNKVIGEMLRYSAAENLTSPKRSLLRIERILRELVEIEEIEATNKGCQINLQSEDNLMVIGDSELLRSGFENVLRNAIRFTADGSDIQLRARRVAGQAGDHILVSVSDCGPGVAAEFLEDIFTPYFQIPEANNQRQGTGLGLAIVKRVFDSHAGNIVARNRDGGGLVIEGSLPAAALD